MFTANTVFLKRRVRFFKHGAGIAFRVLFPALGTAIIARIWELAFKAGIVLRGARFFANGAFFRIDLLFFLFSFQLVAREAPVVVHRVCNRFFTFGAFWRIFL